jgi:polysaccharide export outer membrane protein
MTAAAPLLACLFLPAAAGATASPPPLAPVAAASAPDPASMASPAPSPEYRIGPGDVLEVEVFGNPELSRNPIVQTTGAVALPLVGEVPVAGLTVGEAAARITGLLARDYLVNPQVEVRVKEYQSQFVTVTGEVNTPGRRALRSARTQLIDVLVEAGGLTARASGEIVITRAEGEFEGGGRTLRVQLGAPQLTALTERGLQTPLRAGDIVTASPKHYVTVEGEVARPGRYVLESALTASAAISSAGGLTRFGSHRVRLRRVDPGTGRVSVTTVDLKAVQRGDAGDPPLHPNDTLSVSRRLF